MVKNYSSADFLKRLKPGAAILNAGSASVRFPNCVNVDIKAKPDVDLVCDIAHLPDTFAEWFDAVVCVAVLQYCRDPYQVAREFRRVLKPGGQLFLDAPWVQPFCPDTPDLFRFSESALREIFKEFEIVELGPSIRPGSALAMLGTDIAGSLTENRYVNYALRQLAAVALYPFRWIRTAEEGKTAGAFYMIARKS